MPDFTGCYAYKLVSSKPFIASGQADFASIEGEMLCSTRSVMRHFCLPKALLRTKFYRGFENGKMHSTSTWPPHRERSGGLPRV